MIDKDKQPEGVIASARKPAPAEPPADTPVDAEQMGESVEQAAQEAEDAGATGQDLIAQVKSNIEQHTPPELKEIVDRLVLAGMKMMFDEKTNQFVMAEFKKLGGDAQAVPVAISALITQLLARTKGRMPPPAIVPATLILLMEALAFLDEGGVIKVDADVISDCTEDTAAYLMQKLGLDSPEQIARARQEIRTGAPVKDPSQWDKEDPQGGDPALARPPEAGMPGEPTAGPTPDVPQDGALIKQQMLGG